MTDVTATAHTIITAINERDYETVLANLDPAYEATWPHGTLDLLASGAHEQEMLTAFPDLRFEFVNTDSGRRHGGPRGAGTRNPSGCTQPSR